MKNNVVLSRQFVPDASEQYLDELRASFKLDPLAPISMVIDNLDQTYVQQTLPPVSSMSVKKLMKRRLDRDFGPDDIKGSILLGRENTGRKDWNFLMVSIEKSTQISLWLEFIYSLTNRFIGIYLVAIEVEVILKNIEQAMGVSKTEGGSKWKFFVSHNKVGGFRQVVLRDGRIIFTRMSQPVGESTPEVIAGNIEQEMQSTIEYMKRLSYDPASGLDVYIIAGSTIKPVIDQSKFRVSNFTILTPFEAAQYLGIDGATQPTDQFGDVILAASISSSPKHILKFTTPEIRGFDKLYSIFQAQRAGAAIMALGMLIYVGSILYSIYGEYSDAQELEEKRSQQQARLDGLKAEIKRSDLDIYKTADIMELYQLIERMKISPLEFISQIEAAIKPPVIIKAMEWAADDKTVVGGVQTVTATKSKMRAVFTLEFPDVRTIEEWRVISKKMLAELKVAFKGYDVSFSKIPSKLLETEKLDITFDAPVVTKPTGPAERVEVQLNIKEL
jgi:hypothetical protein